MRARQGDTGQGNTSHGDPTARSYAGAGVAPSSSNPTQYLVFFRFTISGFSPACSFN